MLSDAGKGNFRGVNWYDHLGRQSGHSRKSWKCTIYTAQLAKLQGTCTYTASLRKALKPKKQNYIMYEHSSYTVVK